jgi:hypothetical protein
MEEAGRLADALYGRVFRVELPACRHIGSSMAKVMRGVEACLRRLAKVGEGLRVGCSSGWRADVATSLMVEMPCRSALHSKAL